MSDGDRRAALEMHALGKQDQEWILGRLDQHERARIAPLLSELDSLDIRFDLDPAQLSGDSIAPTAVRRDPPAAAVPASIAIVRNASATAVAHALGNEPQWLIDSVLAIEAWPWSGAVRAAVAGGSLRDGGLRMREPSTAPMRAPARDAALVELLAARLQTVAPATRLNGHRNGHDHAHDPQSRWSRVVSGVRQWLP